MMINVSWENHNQSSYKCTFSWNTRAGNLGSVPASFCVWTGRALKWRNIIEMLMVKHKRQQWLLSLAHAMCVIIFSLTAFLFSKFSTKCVCYFGSQKENIIWKNIIHSTINLDTSIAFIFVSGHWRESLTSTGIDCQVLSPWDIFPSIFRVLLYSGNFKGWQNCFSAFIDWNMAP